MYRGVQKYRKISILRGKTKRLRKMENSGFLNMGIFFKGEGWGSFLKVILMSSIEFQNVFPMINFDIWDRLGHVQTIFDTLGL